MRKALSITAVALTALLSVGCTDSFNEADFITTISSVCLIVNGKTVMEYDDAVHQLAWSNRELQFRMMDDSANDYFIVTISNLPSEMGEVISADILYTTDDNVKTFSGSFNASKYSSGSTATTYWLWNESNKVGAIIQALR